MMVAGRFHAPDRTLGWGGLLALAAGGVLLLGLVASSTALTSLNRASLARASHIRSVLAALNDVSIEVVNAETSQRGYLLTDNPAYLAPYTRAAQHMPEALARTWQELGHDPALAPQIADLQTLVGEKMAELKRTVDLAQSGHRDAALALVKSDYGRDVMDRIQTVYRGVRRGQLAAFLGELDEVSKRGRLALAVDVAVVVGLLAMASVVGAGLARTLRSLRSTQGALTGANDELARLNAELEQRVAERTAELTEANGEIQRFAYIVSHDLRAPLVNIMGFTSELEAATALVSRTIGELAERQPIPAQVAEAAASDLPEAIRFIKASTVKMDRLISTILQLSREGRRVLTWERVGMRALLEAVVDSLQHQIQASGAQVEIGPVPDIDADRLVVEQIFGNLLDNALKYLSPRRPGRIRVAGERRGALVHFAVSDNGRGIAPRDRERVFELFRRAGDQTVPGEGIGLAHVRALVRRLGGRIELESTPDAGTTFHVYLPTGKGGTRSAAA